MNTKKPCKQCDEKKLEIVPVRYRPGRPYAILRERVERIAGLEIKKDKKMS